MLSILYALHRHMVAALHSYANTTWLRFLGSGSHLESKWCHYVMVDTDTHLKLLPTSILDTHNVFHHIDMLSIDMHKQTYTVIPTLIVSDLRVLDPLVESKWCHYVMVEANSHLKLLPTFINDISLYVPIAKHLACVCFDWNVYLLCVVT